MTHYEILGISKKASAEEIKNAYKKLVKKYHPDVYPGDKIFAEKKIKEINEAYDILSVPQKKAEYDESLNSSYSSTSNYYSSNYNQNTSSRNSTTRSSKYSYENYKNTYNTKRNYTNYNNYNNNFYNYYTRTNTNDFNSKYKYSNNTSKKNNNFITLSTFPKILSISLLVIFYIAFLISDILTIKGATSNTTNIKNSNEINNTSSNSISEEEINYSKNKDEIINIILESAQPLLEENEENTSISNTYVTNEVSDEVYDEIYYELYETLFKDQYESFEEFKKAHSN